MSGRRLGRLLGSLFVLAAFAAAIAGVDAGGVGELQKLDIVWQ